jgi:hypothetical protein
MRLGGDSAGMNRSMIAAAILACLSACGGTWKVVRQAPADRLASGTFVVSQCDFSRITVDGKPEQEMLVGASEAAKRGWGDIKNAINAEFSKAFADRSQGYTVRFSGSGLTVKPFIEFISPGCYTGFCSSILRATVQILSPEGTVLDEVQFESKHSGAATEPTAAMRLRIDSRNVGWDVAEYVNNRVTGR